MAGPTNIEIKVTDAPLLGEMHLRSMTGTEELGRLYSYDIDYLTDGSEVSFDHVLGKEMTVSAATLKGPTQHYSGHITTFSFAGFVRQKALYRLTLHPWLWFLSQRRNTRIFQEQTVIEILRLIFDEYPESCVDYSELLQENYKKREYCVQYRESDLDFVSRLMEEEGIYYYFEHQPGEHKMVLVDAPATHEDRFDCGAIPYIAQVGDQSNLSDHITEWFLTRTIQPMKYTVKDYDFKRPSPGHNLQQTKILEHFASDYPDRKKDDDKRYFYETYDHPGGHSKVSNSPPSAAAADTGLEEQVEQAKKLLGDRLDAYGSRFERARCRTNAMQLRPGALFELTRSLFPSQDRAYLVFSARIELRGGTGASGGGSTEPYYACELTAIPSTQQFRTDPTTPRPIVQGPQTAVVVNSSGTTTPAAEATDDANVHTDQYGRVRVRFHWERPYNQAGDKWYNTAFVRVSQAWAGAGWGSMHIPHVGQEVVVGFLEGDPDRPLITGRVYHGTNQPDPEMQPHRNPHISGFRDEGQNRILFDATKGAEEIKLKSPAHSSYLSLGKDGAELFTYKDNWKRIVGNIMELTWGSKLEGVFGLEGGVKVGAIIDFMLGSILEVCVGGKVSLEYGYEAKYSWMGEFKEFDDDVYKGSNKDQVLIAKDGFCIGGGMKIGKGEQQGPKTSLINAYGKGLVLSFGDKTDFKLAGAGKSVATAMTLTSLLVTGALSAAGGVTFGILGEDDAESTGETAAEHSYNTIMSIVAAANILPAILVKKLCFSDDTVEPRFQEVCDSLIGLHEDGITLGLLSDEAKSGSASALQGLLPLEEKDWDKRIEKALDPGLTKMKSAVKMTDDGAITVNSEGRKKRIHLSAGKEAGPDSEILLTDDGILLQTGKSQIHIKKNGNLTILQQGNINLVSDKNVVIGTKGKKDVITISSTQAKIQTDLYTPQLKVMK